MNIQQLLEIAIERKVSDLHFVTGYPPMVRINGELIPLVGAAALTDIDIIGLLSPLLSSAQKQTFDTNFELDFATALGDRGRFRVNVYKQQGHLSAALRLIPQAIPDLEKLGLPQIVGKLVELKQGLILVTGPTGHGKSTTLASLINKINQSRPSHILTIEDPIEYTYPRGKALISQREILVDTKNWSNALKAALREDPDVVLVGEMRDLETIAAAITIAETGHLVLATLHTNSAAQTVDRIIDVFPQMQQPQIRLQLGSVLEAIISQRLVPTLTPGRVLAVELLLKTPALASIIRDGKTHLIDSMIQTSGELGMISLENSLARLVKTGHIDLETAQNYCLRPDVLAKLVTGT